MIAKTWILLLLVFYLLEASRVDARNLNTCESDYDEIHNRVTRQIAPGTKWCGNGDKAANDTDLGYFRETDECCREHDKCPLNIAGYETKYGLKNPDRFTRSHCDCDNKFYDCLLKASSRMSRAIGEIYFNYLAKKCFRNKICPIGTTCEGKYEWAPVPAKLPTVEELQRMYQSLALLEPELEIDPFEAYILEQGGDTTNTTISR